MSDQFDDVIRRETAKALSLTEDEVAAVWDLPMDEEAAESVIVAASEALGRDPDIVFDGIPVPAVRSGITALRGLQSLAPVWDRARQALDEATFSVPLVTPASVAATFRQGSYVQSGLNSGPVHHPIALTTQIAGTIIVVMGAATAFALFTWMGCNPVCRACASLGDVFLTKTLPSVLMMAALYHGLTIGAAVLHVARRPVAWMAQ